MNENDNVIVIECPNCGQKAEYATLDVLDSVENIYEKSRLLNNTLFECKCSKCKHEMLLAYDMVYRDTEHNTLIYMVNEACVNGVYTALKLTDALEKSNKEENAVSFKKRIVSCPHQLREKVLILENGLDDRVVELIKISCVNDVRGNIPDFDPVGATFNVREGELVIELRGDDRVIVAAIPDGLYDHMKREFAEVLECDDEYLINESWAIEVMGIDPYDDSDCDGDCEHCPHNCNDDIDDEWDEDEECLNCERDCDCCDCRKCEEVFDDEDECDGNCDGCHGCDDEDSDLDN